MGQIGNACDAMVLLHTMANVSPPCLHRAARPADAARAVRRGARAGEPPRAVSRLLQRCARRPLSLSHRPRRALAPAHTAYLGKTPEERARVLEATPRLAAAAGQTPEPASDREEDLHFTYFVRAPGGGGALARVVELNGARVIGPIDRGLCTDLLAAGRRSRGPSTPRHPSTDGTCRTWPGLCGRSACRGGRGRTLAWWPLFRGGKLGAAWLARLYY